MRSKNSKNSKLYLIIAIIIQVTVFVLAQHHSTTLNENLNSKNRNRKNLMDYSDADIERLFEQWEENDEEKLPEDELPPYMKKPPKINMDELKSQNMNLKDVKAKMKKDQAVMVFATLVDYSGKKPTKSESEEITAIWQSSLFNANYDVTRYIVEDDKAIFMVKDGSKAWEVKDFLVRQRGCAEVTIDNEKFHGIDYHYWHRDL